MNLQTIVQLRQREYGAESLRIEKVFFEKEEYTAYLASYVSDGLKIYGFLTIPKQTRQAKDQKIIIFNKGYLSLDDYAADRQYVRFVDYFAKNGFIVFKSDYRGHGESEGKAETIFEAGYAVDVLNGIEAIKKGIVIPSGIEGSNSGQVMEQFELDPSTSSDFGRDDNVIKVGDIYMWGHSLGGDVSMKVLEVSQDIKKAVIASAPIAAYDELIQRWKSEETLQRLSEKDRMYRLGIVEKLEKKLGDPKQSIKEYGLYSPVNHLEYVKSPLLIQHGEKDDRVPSNDSTKLKSTMEEKGNEAKIILYPDGDHNFSGQVLDQVMQDNV